MTSKTFRARIVREGSMCFIPLPFDPKAVFGKVRAPVRVTLNGYSYRSTIAAMGGTVCIPLRRSNREAARLEGGESLDVRIARQRPGQIASGVKAAYTKRHRRVRRPTPASDNQCSHQIGQTHITRVEFAHSLKRIAMIDKRGPCKPISETICQPRCRTRLPAMA